MPKVKIIVRVSIVADVPDEHLPETATPKEVHDLIHGLTVALIETMPCAAYGTPEKDAEGDWTTELRAEVAMDSEGKADMVVETTAGLRMAMGEHVH